MDTPAEFDPANPTKSDYWSEEIRAAEKRLEPWHKRGEKVVERYRNETATAGENKRGKSQYNILYSNTETMKGALWDGFPKPDVRRRFVDDETRRKPGRKVSEILERAVSYCIDAYDSDTPIEKALEDWLLPGMGTAWVEYEPEVIDEPVLDERGEPFIDNEDQPVTRSVIVDQHLRVEYVFWKDVLFGYARNYSDVPWVGRIKFMSREDLQREFPEQGSQVKLTASIAEDDKQAKEAGETEQHQRAKVYEIWHKARREVVYYAEGHDYLLDVKPDPLGLENFFPCPRPLFAIDTNDTMTPVPLINVYQYQADELNEVTTRIRKLIAVMKFVGVYNSTAEDAGKLQNIAQLDDGNFVPWKGFGQQGSAALANVISVMPIDILPAILSGLDQYRRSLIEETYQLTGISDIMRGSSQASETKGAQMLKSQFGQQRMSDMRRDMGHFLRDIVRIKAEIIAEHFEPEQLAKITGVQLPMTDAEIEKAKAAIAQAQQMQQPPPPQMITTAQADISWEGVMRMLRDDKLRGYAIDIETEDTMARDEGEEKQARLEFMQAFQAAGAAAIQAAQTTPQMLPLIKEGLLFLVRSFKVGRAMEEQVEDFFDTLQKNPPPPDQQNQPKPANEAEIKRADADVMDAETRRGKAVADVQIAQRDQALKESQAALGDVAAQIEARMQGVA